MVRGQHSLQRELSSLTVGDVMTSTPLTVREGSGIAEAIEGMRARGVRRAPVVSELGDLVGTQASRESRPAASPTQTTARS